MSLRISLFLLVAIVVNLSTLRAQEVSYTAHKKYFYLCAFKKECSYCESCSKDIYKVRIKNNTDKRIESVFYQYYSPLNNRTITNEARIQGEMLEGQGTGNIYVCIKGKNHWAITKIVYSDNSEVSFVVDGPMKEYIQEADECNCNLTPADTKYNRPMSNQ